MSVGVGKEARTVLPAARMSSSAASSAFADSGTATPHLPWRERLTLLAALALISALSWLYLVKMPMVPADLGVLGERLLSVLPPRLADVWLTFLMWSVMMVAMMLPSASSMILTYAAVARRHSGTSIYAPLIFAGAYVVVWALFSVVATAGQFLLENASLLYGASRTTSVTSAVLLMLAGAYQVTPFKNRCLAHCRSPLGFLMTQWRDGTMGAFTMGIKHGAHCLGCCWMLMGLLFVFGAMNLLWIAALSGLVLLEKLAPFGHAIARVSGIAMLAGAIALAVHR
jgi:predicted metal-binding membrane protein